MYKWSCRYHLHSHPKTSITHGCTRVADRAEFEIRVAGGNSVTSNVTLLNFIDTTRNIMYSAPTIPTFTALLFAFMAPGAAIAGLAHPASWKQVSDDGDYVLIMVSPLPVDEDAGHPAFDANEIRSIRARYSQSGLYRNDGTANPLWTLPYHNWTHEFFVGPNGKHLVIADEDWYKSHGHVVSFYSNGNELASYSMTDLVSSIRLKSLINGQMIGCGGSSFDMEAQTFTSRTNQGEEFVFNATDGMMIRRSSPFPVYVAIVATGIVVGVVCCILLLMWRGRDNTINVRRTLATLQTDKRAPE